MENQNGAEILPEAPRNKGGFRRAFGMSALLLLILLLALTRGQELFHAGAPGGKSDPAADAYFPGCRLLEGDCLDPSCSFYNACDGSQKECRIYDCGDEYGIFARTEAGEIRTKGEKKPDLAAIGKRGEACTGAMEVLEQGCVSGHYQAKVKLTTAGECEIGSFTVVFEELGNVLGSFTRDQDSIYTVAADSCGKFVRIKAANRDGVSLDF
jgi:hypothetical protein